MAWTGPGCAAIATGPGTREAFLRAHGIRYWLVVKTEPRALRMHHIEIDLDNPRIELVAALADDPDGDGPATAALEEPLSIARRTAAIALVNANPWQAAPD